MRGVTTQRTADENAPSQAPPNAPPHGVTLFDHAQISAEIAEGDRPTSAVLEAHRLTEAQWNEVTLHWMKRMGDDVMKNRENARIAIVYSDAFAKAQDALKPLPPVDVEGYAALVAAIQRSGSPAPPLSARNLSNADYLRLSRHFARSMASDPAEAKRFFDTLQAHQPPAEAVVMPGFGEKPGA